MSRARAVRLREQRSEDRHHARARAAVCERVFWRTLCLVDLMLLISLLWRLLLPALWAVR